MKIKVPTLITEYKLTEQKSKFIAHVYPFKDINKLSLILDRLKEKYKSAAHIPYAYRVTEINGDRITSQERYSDGGEPTRTAGFPVLKLIHNNKLTNTLIVIVRIFGGVKLGTAGLMQAFTKSSKNALKKNEFSEEEVTETIKIWTSLSKYKDIEKELKKNRIKFKHEFDGDDVLIKAFAPIEDDDLKAKIRLL